MKPSVFSDNENLGDEIERPFRPSGVVALILGVISVGTLASVQMVVVPIMAIAVALVALRPTRGKFIQPSGRGLAVAGMSLALLFGSWGVAYYQVRKSHLQQGATAFSLNWLEVLGQGKREIAYELAQPRNQRQLQTMSLKTYYGINNPEVNQQYESFMGLEAPRAIFAAKDKPQWRADGVVRIYRMFDSDYVAVRMIDTTGTIERPVVITACRSPWITPEGDLDLEKPRQWHIRDIGFAESKSS